jgi:hypothetical protein
MTTFPIQGLKLTQFQLRVWEWLQSRSHLSQGICQAAETLARSFGCSRRYVERTLKFFLELGVLRRVTDYGLRTRRRFFVVGTAAESPLFPIYQGDVERQIDVPVPLPVQTNSLGALQCAQSAHSSALTDDPPPDPSIEVSGEISNMGVGGEATPPPPEVCAPDSEEEQIAALADQVRHVIPEHTPTAGWVRNLVARFSLPWVQAAIRRAQDRRAAGADIRTGYVIATLKGFREEGSPPPELTSPPPAPKVPMDRDEWRRRMEEKLARLRGGKRP